MASGLSVLAKCSVCDHWVARHLRAAALGSAVPVAAAAAAAAAAGASSHPSATSIASLLSRLSEKIPQWSSQSVAHTFLQRITQVLSTSGVDQSKWNLIFPFLVKDVTAGDWIQEHIIAKKLDWDASQKAFTSHFQTSDYGLVLQREFDACRQGKNEPVQAYADRFISICSQLGFADNNELVIHHFVTHLNQHMFNRYHDSIGQIQLTDEGFKIQSLRKAADHCRKLDLTSRAATVYMGSSRDGSTGGSNASASSSSSSSSNAKTTGKCKFHPNSTNHTTAECKTRDSKQHKSGGNHGSSGNAGGSNGQGQKKTPQHNKGTSGFVPTCYECGQQGHKRPDCPQLKNKQSAGGSSTSTYQSVERHTERSNAGVPPKRTTYERRVNLLPAHMAVVEPLTVGDSESGTTVLDRTLPAAVVAPTAATPTVWFMHNHMLFDTLLDSGADVSIIDAELVKNLGITVIPAAGKVKQVSAPEPAGRIGYTEPIEVTALFPVPHLREQLPAKTMKHSFEVLELGDEPFQFIIGRDLIRRLIPKHLIGEFIPDESKTPAATCVDVAARSASIVFDDRLQVADQPSLAIDELAGDGHIPLVERARTYWCIHT